MRTPLIAGNFKMFKTVTETISYVNDLRVLIKDLRGVDVAIAPLQVPFRKISIIVCASAAPRSTGALSFAGEPGVVDSDEGGAGTISSST